MTLLTRSAAVLPFLLLALTLLAPAPSSAQDAPPPATPASALPDEVTLETDAGATSIVIDIPVFKGDAAVDGLVRRVIKDDLHFSGLFEIVPEGTAAPYRVEGFIEPTPEKDAHAVTFTLRETAEGRILVAKRFRGGGDALRRVGHRIAEEIVKVFTGRAASFDTRIAFASNAGDKRDIYVMDYDGANMSRVTNDGALVLSPDVSPDGQLLIFTSYVSRLPSVYVIRRDTGAISKLLAREGLTQSPSFSPDGSRLALSATFEGNSEIYTSDVLGKGLRRLTDHPGIDVSPAWSPTAREIAFVSDRTGTPQVHVMSADGLDVRRLTFEGAYNTEPAFSPDGTLLTYSSRQSGRFQICVLDLATNRVTTITDGRSNNESPSWSPDGEFLAIASDRGGKYDIWVMRKDGTAPRRVGTRGENRFPFWYR